MERIDRDEELVQIIWEFCLLHQPLKRADIIFVLGSHDLRVAERAAELYHQGLAPLIVFSGGFTQRKSPSTWDRSEAEIFAEVAIEQGVPTSAIIKEDQAGNTGENVEFTKKLLKEKGILVQTVIAVQKPYMERRTLATTEQRWPEIDLMVTSPQLSYSQYLSEQHTKDRVINNVVGDVQRLKIYAEKGFSTRQEIPDNVWQAYEELVAMGYDKQLVGN